MAKKERGRAMQNAYHPRIDATPEEMAKACSLCRLTMNGSTKRMVARSIGVGIASGKSTTLKPYTGTAGARVVTIRPWSTNQGISC